LSSDRYKISNFSGVITYDRLVELAGEIKSISRDDIMRAFKTFDLNGDNFISLIELKVLLQKVRSLSLNLIFDSILN
jgi:Ca2+-binding EF-hand superfamily protein